MTKETDKQFVRRVTQWREEPQEVGLSELHDLLAAKTLCKKYKDRASLLESEKEYLLKRANELSNENRELRSAIYAGR